MDVPTRNVERAIMSVQPPPDSSWMVLYIVVRLPHASTIGPLRSVDLRLWPTYVDSRTLVRPQCDTRPPCFLFKPSSFTLTLHHSLRIVVYAYLSYSISSVHTLVYELSGYVPNFTALYSAYNVHTFRVTSQPSMNSTNLITTHIQY